MIWRNKTNVFFENLNFSSKSCKKTYNSRCPGRLPDPHGRDVSPAACPTKAPARTGTRP